MIIPIGPAGSLGIIRDLRPHELPLAAWTDGNNVRFADGKARNALGYQQVYNPPTVAPYGLMYVQVPSGPFWIYTGLAKVYATDGATHAEITRAVGGNYTGAADDTWTGGVLGGVPVLNNGVDTPQFWASPSLSNDLANLTNWPANTLCASLRPFKSYLVALDVTESGTRYPQMVRWSHPADPGTIPSTWDYTDATKSAGRIELKETSDYCVDSTTLRDINIIYKEYSTWGMQFVGGNSVFRFYKIFDNIGAMSRRVAAEFFSGQQIVMTLDDVVVHDGQQARSILDARWRRTLQGDLDASKYRRFFVAVDWPNNEVWCCYVPLGASWCTRALVWNFRENQLSLRDLPNVMHAAAGTVDLSGVDSNVWDTDTGTWDSDSSSWDATSYSPLTRRLLMAGVQDTKLYAAYGYAANGSNVTSFLERTGLGIPLRVDAPPDFTTMKQLKRLWLHAGGETGRQLSVQVAAYDNLQDIPVYGAAMTYTIGSDMPLDCAVQGRLFAIKIQAVGQFQWELSSIDYELARRGMF